MSKEKQKNRHYKVKKAKKTKMIEVAKPEVADAVEGVVEVSVDGVVEASGVAADDAVDGVDVDVVSEQSQVVF